MRHYITTMEPTERWACGAHINPWGKSTGRLFTSGVTCRNCKRTKRFRLVAAKAYWLLLTGRAQLGDPEAAAGKLDAYREYQRLDRLSST